VSLNHKKWYLKCKLLSLRRLKLQLFMIKAHRSKYEGKSLNNRNFILKCMEKYAQWKILFLDTKWLLSNMSYRGHDDQAVWAHAVGRTTWPLHCQLAPWKSNEALFVVYGQRVWNLLKSIEEWRFSMAPSDFHLFGPMKEHLRGQKFADDD